jgi:hypothetical protein
MDYHMGHDLSSKFFATRRFPERDFFRRIAPWPAKDYELFQSSKALLFRPTKR